MSYALHFIFRCGKIGALNESHSHNETHSHLEFEPKKRGGQKMTTSNYSINQRYHEQ